MAFIIYTLPSKKLLKLLSTSENMSNKVKVDRPLPRYKNTEEMLNLK